jgi:outer membrane protein assembly factor BamC
MKVLQIGISSVALVLLAGCSMFEFGSKHIDYAAAGKVSPLKVPPDLTIPASHERYQVPQGGATAPGATKSPSLEVPPNVIVAAGNNLNKATQGEGSSAAINATGPEGLASLREVAGGNTIIVLNDPFDRSWRKVGLALESAGLVVNDKDREKGIYYLRPVRLDKSWLDKLMFWKSDEDTRRHYRVKIKDDGTSCEVSIVDQDGASNKISKQMLEAIYKNINQPQ